MTVTNARPKGFTPERIARTALEILEKEGPEVLSFRRVADVLGTNQVMIYRRCRSREGLLDLCADLVAADFPSIDESAGWAVRTQLRFEAAHDMWAEHSDLILLMGGRSRQGRNMLTKFYEPAMKTPVDAGLPIPEAATIFSTLYRLTIGSVISTRRDRWRPRDAQEALNKLGPELFPTLAQVSSQVDNTVARGTFQVTLR